MIRKRISRRLCETWGRATTIPAAAMPPTPTTANPMRTATEFPGQPAATNAKGARAAAVDQAQRHEREADRPHACGTAGEATDDRDPDELVEAAGKDDAHERRPSAGGGERNRAGSLRAWKRRAQPIAFSKKATRKRRATEVRRKRAPVRERHRRIADVPERERRRSRARRGRNRPQLRSVHASIDLHVGGTRAICALGPAGDRSLRAPRSTSRPA